MSREMVVKIEVFAAAEKNWLSAVTPEKNGVSTVAGKIEVPT